MSTIEPVLLILFAFSNLTVVWSVRTWQSNLNYNNPRNWVPSHTPCPADRLILRPSEPLVLELPEGQTSVRGMVLAENSELVLPFHGSVQLTGEKHSVDCSGQDVVFKHTRPMQWVDATNWDGWNKATPDLERPPCVWEDVRIPPGTTINIITPQAVKIGTLEINGVMMDAFDWFNYINNEDLNKQLHKQDGNPPLISYSTMTCRTDTWCGCNNEYLQNEVCRAACPMALCRQPVKPSGFCCPICGAYFLLRSKDYRKQKLADLIDSFLKDKGIVWHASKVGELIQIVLVEAEEYSGEIAEIANKLKSTMERNGEDWKVEHLYASGHVWYPITVTQVVGHFLSLMVFAAITLAAIIVFYSKDWSWLQFSTTGGRPFVFARFENQSGEIMVAHEARPPSPPSPPQAFDNPMYGSAGQAQRNVTVENPIYTELNTTTESCSAEEAETVLVSSPDL